MRHNILEEEKAEEGDNSLAISSKKAESLIMYQMSYGT